MSIPGGSNPLLLASAGGAGGGYEIERSLRFNSSDSAYLSRTPASAGNRKTWTWSGWIKRAKLGTYQTIFGRMSGSTDDTWMAFRFQDNDKLVFLSWNTTYRLTTQVFRDVSAWYHLVVALDTTQATAADRLKIYVNGTQITTFDTNNAPTQNADLAVNGAAAHGIGYDLAQSANAADLYLADIHFIDGQALDPSSFTEVSATTGRLEPKAYSGSFGTNGFWLKFSDNSAATATTLGKDYSGNNNNWAPNNIAVGGAQPALYSSPNLYTSAADVIANGTPLSSGSTFSNVYVYLVTNGGGDVGSKVFTADGSGTIGTNWTWLHRIGASWDYAGSYNSSEWDLFTWGSQTIATTYVMNNSAPLHMLVSSAGSPQQVTGTIATFNSTPNSGAGNDSLVDTPTSYGTDTGAGGEVRGNYCTWNPLQSSAATLANGNLDCTTAVGTGAQTRGTIAVSTGKWYWEVLVNTTVVANNIGIIKTSEALAADRPGASAGGYNYVGFSGNKENNASASSYGATYGSGDVIGVALDLDAGTLVFYKNGTSQGTAFSSLSGEFIPAIGDGTGSSGMDISANFGQRQWAYAAPSGFRPLVDTLLPAPVVAKPSTAMDVKLYTGNGSTQTISGLGFSPDLVWTKTRSQANNNFLFDSVRGVGNWLISDSTTAETYSANTLTSFNSDGFTTGSNNDTNASGRTFVAWTWDAGTTTTTNTVGSITSSCRTNQSSGFSIVTWTGDGTTATIGHGGLVNLDKGLIIVKSRSTTGNWMVGHGALGWTQGLEGLNTTNAANTSSSYWNNTAPTSTVFTVSGADANMNGSGRSQLAYCFAPVAGYSSAFSYSGNGDSSGPFVHLGFRPRFIIQKRTDSAGSWLLIDTARDPVNVARNEMFANSSAAEYDNGSLLDVLSNGFKIRATFANMNASGGSYIGFAFAESPFQYARAR